MASATSEEILSSVHTAHARISDVIVETPLIESKWLSEETGCNIFLKLESEQITGSLKLRGAANKVKMVAEQWSSEADNKLRGAANKVKMVAEQWSSEADNKLRGAANKVKMVAEQWSSEADNKASASIVVRESNIDVNNDNNTASVSASDENNDDTFDKANTKFLVTSSSENHAIKQFYDNANNNNPVTSSNGNHAREPSNSDTDNKPLVPVSSENHALQKVNGDSTRKKTLVTASTGNHALALALITSKIGINLKVYSYLHMSKSKEKMITSYKNVELLKHGDTFCAADAHGRSEAYKCGLPFISAYNDIDGIHGQATIGLELLKQNKDLNAVFVTVGRGGVMGGIAMYLKHVKPSVKVIACQPSVDCCMYQSVQAGHIVRNYVFTKTISDGSSGGIESGSMTFDIVRRYVDEWVLVDEDDIERAIYDMLVNHNKIIEGAAGCTIAAVRKIKERLKGQNVALVICGANLGMKYLSNIVQKFSPAVPH